MQTTTKLDRKQDNNEKPQPEGKKRTVLVISWALVVLILLAIFLLSNRSGYDLAYSSGIITAIRDALIEAGTAIFGQRVDVSPVGHFFEYFLLGLALTNALRLSFPPAASGCYAVFFASLYGITDELHQVFIPGRSCDIADWLVDTIAALLAAIIFLLVLHVKKKHANSQTSK